MKQRRRNQCPCGALQKKLLSNLYAATGNLELSESVERQRKERDAKKQPGRTWIEVNDAVHTFVVDDQNPCRTKEIVSPDA